MQVLRERSPSDASDDLKLYEDYKITVQLQTFLTARQWILDYYQADFTENANLQQGEHHHRPWVSHWQYSQCILQHFMASSKL